MGETAKTPRTPGEAKKHKPIALLGYLGGSIHSVENSQTSRSNLKRGKPHVRR
jgi:hypothetical protein